MNTSFLVFKTLILNIIYKTLSEKYIYIIPNYIGELQDSVPTVVVKLLHLCHFPKKFSESSPI